MEPDPTIDRATFEELIGRYQNRVLKKALSWARQPFDAADIVQNTYLRAWASRHTLVNLEAFGRWIEVICQRECWRASHRTREIALEDVVEPIGAVPETERAGTALPQVFCPV